MDRESGPESSGPGEKADPLIGKVLGSFRVERQLGRGGMGTVYLARHTVIGSKVAIKVLHRELGADPTLISRFVSEAQAVNRIGHENIVAIYDLNVSSPERYLVMEYLSGVPLSARMTEPMDAVDLLPILIQALSALDAAHREGVVHRDLKPDNIFLVQRTDRTQPLVKLLDFGVAKLLEGEAAQERTSAGMVLGTPAYMAPEQWGNGDVDGRADLYSLGVTAYRALTGRLPFRYKSMVEMMVAHRTEVPPEPHRENPRISETLSRIVMRALAKAPRDRFASAAEMRHALSQLLDELKPSPERAPKLEAPKVRLLGPKGDVVRELHFSDLTRGGVFLHWEPPFPELLSRMQIELEAPAGLVRVAAEVVRHVGPQDARSWGMSPGVGVQFVGVSPEVKAALKVWLAPLHAPPIANAAPAEPRRITPPQPLEAPIPLPPRPEMKPFADPELHDAVSNGDAEAWARRVEELLESWFGRAHGNHYQVLKLRQDADFDEIRRSASEMIRRLLGGTSTVLTHSQVTHLRAALDRIRAAARTLLDPKARASFDAELRNFKGVARCIKAGLSREELDALHREWVEQHPMAVASARVAIRAADPLLEKGFKRAARELYERGLKDDPLNPELHDRFMKVEPIGAH